MNQAKTFFWRLTIIAVSLVLTDILLGNALAHYYARINRGEEGRLNYAMDSMTTPIVVFGGSRALRQYVPAILHDSLHQEAFNAGQDKQEIFYYQSVFTDAIRRYHPQTVLMDLTPVLFTSKDGGLDVLSMLLPYYHQHPEIRPFIDKRSPWEKVKTLSALYRYNAQPLRILFRTVSNAEFKGADHGYLPIFDTLQPRNAQPYFDYQVTDPPNPAVVAAFEQFIQLVQDNHCRLAVIVSPGFIPLTGGTSTMRLAADICRRKNIPFLDYSLSPDFCGHTGIFYDSHHLNDSGAHRFTRILASDLIAKGFR
jgi:hypothetical protein